MQALLRSPWVRALWLLATFGLSACGGGSSGSPADPTFVLGGTLTGLPQGGQVLLLSGAGTQVTLSANGNFEFPGRLKAGSTYDVTVNRHPVGHTCNFLGASTGSIPTPGSDVRRLTVVCTAHPYTLGGTVSGLRPGSTLALADGGRDGTTVTVSANGPFNFPVRFAQGGSYGVTVQTQPAGQECRLTAGTGTFATASISTVAVSCTALTATIGGTISGLAAGQQVVLSNNDGDRLTASADGKFQFSQAVDYGGSYSVAVVTQPTSQLCAVSEGTGSPAAAAVTTVRVTCSARTYSVGGTVVGLSGVPGAQGLTLLNNGSDLVRLAGNGSFVFPTRQPTGSDFAISIAGQPTGQMCTVFGAAGRVESDEIRSVSVQCIAGAWRSRLLAGSGVGRTTDGVGANAEFAAPAGLALLASGQMLVGEISGSVIRRVNPSTGQVSTYSGASLPGYVDGTTTRNAAYRAPHSIAVDRDGNVYIADSGNHVIRRIDAFSGAVTTWAGTGVSGHEDGQGGAARFNNPQAVAVDPAGNVYVADTGNHVIRRIDTGRVVSTVAGSIGVPGFANGLAAAARFRGPAGIAVDASGQVYVADSLNGAIRMMSLAGQVTTLAGNGVPGDADGSGAVARFSAPAGLYVDAQYVIYVADSGNHKIKMMQVMNGVGLVQTIAGTGMPGDADGESLSIGLRQPWGLSMTPSGELVVSEAGGHRLRSLARVVPR